MDLGALIKDRCVLVTGASSGLGSHFGRLFARCGARVVLAARRTERLEALRRELAELGSPESAVAALDVADPDSVQRVFANAGAVDVVVNNAGISGAGLALAQPVADFDAVMATNLRGVWLVATEAARCWRAAGRGGTIVNIASIQGERVAPGLAAYSASKAGVLHLTRSLALEWARHGIRVNALAPGYVRTELNAHMWEQEHGRAMLQRIPMRRLGQPEDLDGALLLLATEASAWMTGSVISVDGGHLVSAL